MSTARFATAAAIGLIPVLITSQARAASDADAEIALLKQQLKLMEQKLDKLQKQTSANTASAAKANAKVDAKVASVPSPGAAAVYPVKEPVRPFDTVVHMPNNRPTICTVDEQNCIALTTRLHFDAGGYNYRPDTAATSPQKLDDGINARRARIGILGKFLGDWNYALIYDFGGSSDGFGGTAGFGASNGVGGTTVGLLPGGGTSGIEQAFLSYTGLKPFGGKLAIEAGYMDTMYTLDEATSSNDILFMERASPGIIATNIAAGDFRSAAGARWYTDTFWIGAYETGPLSGAIHSASSLNPNGSSEQAGTFVRVAGQALSGPGYSFHLGGGAEFLTNPPRNQVTGAQTLTLSDRPELRIDPTVIVTTGALAGVSSAQVYNGELAGTYGPLFWQGEYFWYNIDRGALPNLSNINFQGGYGEVAYVLTGETHTYNPGNAAYNGILPANPFSLSSGGWGAWEIAGRVSTINLNDQLALANGVAGGRQTIYTAGLNWYVNGNIRFMFNYLHGDITKQLSATNTTDTGAKFDAFAMRTQVAF